MKKSKGIIINEGGFLSLVSIISREHGIGIDNLYINKKCSYSVYGC